jgi:probable HAF family extracellular repeat protein
MSAIRQTVLRTAKILVLFVLALSALHSAVVQAQQYTLTVIPRLPGQTASFATGLNDAGQVVGYSGSVAWLWDGNTLTNLDPGQGFSFAYGINDAGQVVGYAVLTPGATSYHATVWNGTTPTDLGTLVAGGYGEGLAINASGQVAGWATIEPDAYQKATVWNGTTPTDLGALGTANYLLSQATAINAAGRVVGWSQNPDTGNQNATVWNGTALTNLGTAAQASIAYGINASGQVVGYSTANSVDGAATLWNGSTATDLGALPGATSSVANGINDAGQVVGNSVTATSGVEDATLWTGGQVLDLNSLVFRLPPYITLFNAVAINNKGQIVVNGGNAQTTPPQVYAYLLTPVAPLTLTCPRDTAQVGDSYSSVLAAAGGISPYTFSIIGSLPSGLSLNTSTGAITGTPATPEPFNFFTAQVTDSSGSTAGTVTKNCRIIVHPATPKLSVTPTSLPFGTVRQFEFQYKTVTLTNTGTVPVSMSRTSVSPDPGTDHGIFTSVSWCGRSLAPEHSCTITIVLFAGELGSLSATLNIPNNAVGSPQTVPLSATSAPLIRGL